MQINITGKDIKITTNVRDFINKKVQKVLKDFEQPIDCNVILTREKRKIFAEITMQGDNGKFYFKKSAGDIYSAVENVVHSADLSIKKFKDKQKDKKWKMRKKRTVIYGKERIQIVDYKIDELKPMSPEESFLQMKYLKKNFIVFVNAKTDKANIMYKENRDLVLLKPVSKIKFFLGLYKLPFEKWYIEYKANKIKIKQKEKLDLQIMNEKEVVENLKEKNKFMIFRDKRSNRVTIMFWAGKNKIGRYII